MQSQLKVELSPVQRRVPLIVAAVAFVIYAITLNHSATFSGLINLARAVGWDWRPNIASPLQVLVTLPVRFLPASVQLLALNLISAVCAAGALGMLARCVSLLPHDRTRDQRQVERSEFSLLSIRLAWVPPVLAAAVAGLQLSFWENAVVGTAEALDLLVFAWLVQSLLMFRLDQRESRLGWFAFVYGLGVTNNYALIGFAPLFLGALIWIRGLAFFRIRFLVRLTLLGLAGTLLYLLLPTLAVVGGDAGYTWWDMLRSYWASQRDSLLGFPRVIVLLLALTSVLPVVFIGIRWPAQFGEVSPIGNSLTNLMTHVIHAVFLLACTYVAFDQFFSPRNLAGKLTLFLPFYFLGALSVGYCAGYFLLIGGSDAEGTPQWQRASPWRRLAGKAAIGLILLALLAVPGLLAYQNLPRIWANTGTALSRISSLSVQSLPRDGAVVLSDEPFRLYALENEMRQGAVGRDQFILVDTKSLESGGYHLHMLRKYPNVWPKVAEHITAKQRIPGGDLVQLMLKLSAQRPVFYIHPSFGYYFEFFEMVPKGLVYQMRPVSSSTLSAASLTPAEIAEGEQFWQKLRESELEQIARVIPPAEFPSGAKAQTQPMTLEMYVGRLYSLALNYFGVALQRAGQSAGAAGYYDLAVRLDPYNAAAMINAEYNRLARTGRVEALKVSDDILKRIGVNGGSWEGVLAAGGPVEEPGVCYALARAFDSGNNPRQAGQYLERVVHYDPTNVMAQVILVGLSVRAGLPDLALTKIAGLRASPLAGRLSASQVVELAVAEGWAYASKNNLGRAVQILREEMARQPGDPAPWQALFDIYQGSGQVTNALAVAEDQLKFQPRNVQTLVNVAVVKGSLGQLADGVVYLNRALEISPKDEFALYNRAKFNAALGKLDLAQKDFESIQFARGGLSTRILLELADVYFRKKNNREALRVYRQVLKALPEASPDRPFVEDRIRQLD